MKEVVRAPLIIKTTVINLLSAFIRYETPLLLWSFWSAAQSNQAEMHLRGRAHE